VDDNDNFTNVGARQYLRPEGYVFNLQNVVDRNILPGNNVYVFEGWRVFVGATYSPTYLVGFNANVLHGTFTVPHVSVGLWESFTTFIGLNSELVGEAITLQAVWSLYEAGDDNGGNQGGGTGGQGGAGGQGGTGTGTGGTGTGTGTLPKTGVENSNTLLFVAILLLALLVGTGAVVAIKEKSNKDILKNASERNK